MDLPENLLGKLWEGKYRGQKQKWFIMKFLGKNEEINVKTKHPEFLDWKWIESIELTKVAVDFKINVYEKLKKELASLNFKLNSYFFKHIKLMIKNVTIMICNIFYL